ncbi:MAG: MFS transporter [Planctomycetes bacterium]|nr:MFS transporter [Planctomycetota bacterium]
MTHDSGSLTSSPSMELSKRGRYLVLVAAFLGWMCAGMQMGNFPLATGSIVQDFLGASLDSETIKVESGKWFGWFICAFLLGAACGGLLFGWLGDHIGRAKTMGLSILCYSLLHGACFYAQSLEQLLVLRFLACFGVGGMWPTGVALASEAWSEASRPMLAGLIGTSANVGIALNGVIGEIRKVTQDEWRWLMLVSAVPAVLGIFVLLFVPDSPRWLAHRRDHSTQKKSTPVAVIFRSPYLKLTLIGICLGTVPLLGGWGTNNWLIRWADQVGEKIDAPKLKATTVWVGSTGAAIGSLLGGWLASYFGRRSTYFVISLGSLILSGYIFWQLTPADGTLFLTWVFFLRLVSTVYFGWLPLYLPELFPTEIRSTGSGVTFNFGRILSVVGVLGTGALVGYFQGDYAATGRITHWIFALGMIVILFAPDTSGKRMDD